MPRQTGQARERVLAAADELFYGRGINAVGINEIVERAGVAKTSLYLHFASKNDLVVTYLAERTALYMREWTALVAAHPDATAGELVDLVFDGLAEFAMQQGYRGCPFQLAAAELPGHEHPGFAAIAEYRRYVREELFGEVARRAGLGSATPLQEQLGLLYDAALDCSFADGTPAPVERARETAHIVLENALGQAAR